MTCVWKLKGLFGTGSVDVGVETDASSTALPSRDIVEGGRRELIRDGDGVDGSQECLASMSLSGTTWIAGGASQSLPPEAICAQRRTTANINGLIIGYVSVI